MFLYGLGDRILLVIVSFLLTIFPWSTNLIGLSQQLSYPGRQNITNMVAEMVKTDDVDKIYELTCEHCKENHPELKNELHEMVSCIDGEIVSYNYSGSRSHSDSKQAWDLFSVILDTSAQKQYSLQILYLQKDPYHPKDVGILGLCLSEEKNFHIKHYI